MEIIELFGKPDLSDTTLVIAMKGWVDGGGVASRAGEHLAGSGPIVARFDPDSIYDYAGRRPLISFEAGTSEEIAWPNLVIRHNEVDGRDLILLLGDEPQIGWNALTRDMSEIVGLFGVVKVVTLGAIPAQVPHTRPTPLLITSTDPDIQPSGVPAGRFVVPAAAANAVDHHLKNNAGLPTVGFWAQVPHYVTGVYWPAVLTVVERVGMYLETPVDTSELSREAAEMLERLDRAVSERPEAREFLARIEGAQAPIDEILGQGLANEVEDFLRAIGEDENPFA